MMEQLYNPDAMAEAEFKNTFIGRETLLHDLLALLRSQPEGAGVQHAVIIAPRGMGKTSVLCMLRYAVLESELAATWWPLKFPEELYGVADLTDFWLETLRLLAIDIQAPELAQQAQTLPKRFHQRADVAAAAFALLKDFRRRHGKRLLLMVENLDSLFGTMVSEQDNACLRDTLMNDDTVMLAGSAVEYFKQVRAYDHPLYNFLRIFNLRPLSFEESRQLLAVHGAQDNIPDFVATLQTHATRLRALHHFTQGIPRLVLMLYRVLTRSDVNSTHQALEKLLDEVTPYYQARIAMLSVQQRKLLEHIARIAASTHEGVSPTALARAVQMSVNQVSSQLKRMLEDKPGFLRTAPLRGRSTCYLLAEPLYALWHQMRLNPETRTRKLVWLVNFLHEWYDDHERLEEAKRLFHHYEESERSHDGRRALSALEHLHLLAQSALPTPVFGQVQLLATRVFVRLRGNDVGLQDGAKLSDSMLTEQFSIIEMGLARHPNDASSWAAKGDLLLWGKREYEAALQCLERALELEPNDASIWGRRGIALYFLERYTEALASEDRALELDPSDAVTWSNRGVTLAKLQRYTEALASYNRVLELDPQSTRAKNNRAEILLDIEDNFLDAVSGSQYETAHAIWNVLRRAVDAESTKRLLKRGILFAAELGHLAFARELLGVAALQEEYFPLDRALVYLQSKQEAVLEKLSPEIKEAVRVVVSDLRASLQQETSPGMHPFARVKLALDDDYIAKRGHLVHKLKAKDSTKRWASYFVLVSKAREQSFLDDLNRKEIRELTSYGRLIASNYGEEPDEHTKSLLKKKYNFSV